MPEFGECPKHGRYECSELDGKPIRSCGACGLERLQVEAKAWFKNLPPEHRAVYARRDKIRALYGRKATWTFLNGLIPGMFFGAGFYIYAYSDVRHMGICMVGAVLSNFGFSYMRGVVARKIITLEQERNNWEVEQMRR